MEAIVLAGGMGLRLRSIVPDVPKPMAPVAGRPFLEILLTTLARQGFQRVVLSLGYKAEAISTYFGASLAGMELVYEIEASPLGTGGAIHRALTRCHEDHVFIFNGDTYLELDVVKLETNWQNRRNPVIVACNVEDTARYGRLELDDGRVIGFMEKGTKGPGLINAGCYVLPRDILDEHEPGEAFSFESEYLVEAVKQRQFDVFVSDGKFIDIGLPEDYARAQTELIVD